MHDIAFFTSPFDLSRREFFCTEVGHTIREALIAHDLLERMTENAVLVACNGVELLESQWDKVIDDADIITLHLLPQGPAVFAWIVANWVTIAYVIVTALYISNLPEPELPGSIPEASPSYSISARGNAARLGSPKPVFYGRVRTWPDLSSIPFTEFLADSTQVLYQLYEVRQGDAVINVADMRIEDTPLSNFSDYEVEVIQPGQKSTLFPSQMVTSNEFSNLKIVEVMNSYVACDIGQRTTRLTVDVIAAGGIFGIYKKNGNLSRAFAQFYVEAQQIDDSNNPLGGYVRLSGKAGTDYPDSEYWDGSTRDVIRRSLSYPVAAGRYRVRVVLYRSGAYGNVDDYQMGGDGLTWVGLRAMLVDEMPVTTTTRIALKIRASEQLGGKSLGRFNCISTGKISTWNPTTGWGAPTLTANPAWVFADVARNMLYGGARDDAFIGLAGLYALAQQYDVEGIRFDGGFDTATTVWDALTKVAAVAQAVPVDRAGIYYMVRDVQGSPSYMFTHSNIVRDSFKISYVSVLDETADSVRVNYFDETNDYRINSMLCMLPGSTTNTTRDVTLFGCTNKDRAFKWGMYLAAMNQYRRISVEFDTGIEGYLPFFYDTVAVSHYLVGRDSLAQVSGDVIAFDGNNILTLSEKVSGLTTPYIIIRGLDGSPSSPYPVTVLDDYRVQIAGGFDSARLVFDAGFERPHFMCGEGSQFYARIKINKISPQGNGVYRISGFVDAPEVYTASNGLPTPPVNVLPAVVNRKPLVEHLAAALSGTVDSAIVTLSWSGRYSDYYVVEFSTDAGTTWLPVAEGKFITTFVEHLAVGVIHYRVAGFSIFRGDFVTLVVDTSASQFISPTPVSNVHLASAFIGPYATILWTSAYTDHHVKIKKSGVVFYELDVTGNSIEINADDAAKYNLGRSFDIEVFSIAANGLYSTTAGTLSVSNSPPGAVTGILTVAGYSQIHLEWNASTETDLGGYQVWMSATSGFTPGAGNLIYDGLDNKLIIRTLNGGTPIVAGTAYYLRVAAYDQFGKTGLTISSEFSSTPLKISAGISAGEITGAMVASGALDMTKFASGIRPPRTVTSLPTIDGTIYKNQDTVVLTSDGLLYRAVAGAWTTAVPAVNVTGTLTDAQLAAISAAKITGTLVDSQLAAIAAAKVTGTLADSQLAAISAAKVTGQIVGTQIADNSISTPKLIAGSVTTDKLLVTGGTALSLNPDPNFLDVTAWTFTNVTQAASTSPGLGAWGAVAPSFIQGTSVDCSAVSKGSFPVTSTKTYYVSANLYAAAGNNRYVVIQINFYNNANTLISTLNAWVGAPTNVGFWARSGSTFGAAGAQAIPGGAVKATLSVTLQWNGAGSSSVLHAAQDFRIEEILGGTLIQDGAITTNKIAANTITAANIAADTITSTQIAANAITASELAAGAVTAGKIAAGTIVANDIAALTITATQIAASTITASKIATGTITANEIAANTITAAKIAAGAIGATQIAANAITTDKIYIQSAGKALNIDPNCSDITAWTASGAFFTIATVTDGYSGVTTIRNTNTTGGQALANQLIPVDITKTYRIKAALRRSATANGYGIYGLECYDGSGSVLANVLAVVNPLPASWTSYSSSVGPGLALTLPANCKSVRMSLWLNWTGTLGYAEAQDVTIEEFVPGTLIMDGAITTNKIAANAITAGQIAANAITATQIAANSITGDRLVAGTVTATQIDSRGLTIKDSVGNVVLSAGTQIPVDAATAYGFNPQFSDWPSASTYPANWGAWSGTPFRETVAVETSPYAVTWSVSGNAGMQCLKSWAATPLPVGTYISGSYSVYIQGNAGGSGKPHYLIRLFTNSALTVYVDTFAECISNSVTGWQRVPFTAGVGTGQQIYGIQLYQMASYSGAPSGSWSNGSVCTFDNLTFDVRQPINGTNVATMIASGSNVLNTEQQWSQVGGSGKPADNATVGATFGTNISGQITAANVSTYIAAAAIDYARIGSVDAGTISVGTLAAARIATGSLDANKLTAGTITTDRLVVGSVNSTVAANGASAALTLGGTNSQLSGSPALYPVSMTKTYAGSSIRASIGLKFYFTTSASLSAGYYRVDLFCGGLAIDNGAGSQYSPMYTTTVDESRTMYLVASTTYYVCTSSLDGSLISSSGTGTARLCVLTTYIYIKNTSTGAAVNNSLAGGGLEAGAILQEIKV